MTETNAPRAQFYIEPILAAIERIESYVHDLDQAAFEVQLARSGLTLKVQEGSTILDAVLDAGLDVSFSCSEGICGTCETRVLSGVPDHRDLVLTEVERQSNATVMICCSGSKSPILVLDL